MPPRRPPAEGKNVDTFETKFWGHSIRIETPRAAREADARHTGPHPGRVFIDGEEVPIETTEGGFIPHDDMAFKEYGSLEELAEDVIRQRGSARIVRGEPHHPPH